MTGGFVPLVEPLGPTADPADVCARFLDLPYVLFLDSAATQHPDAQYSFLAADPFQVVRSKGTSTEIRNLPGGDWTRVEGDALSVARALLPSEPIEPVPGLPPFQGGIAGYIGYDWGAVLERLPRPRYDDLAIPDVVLGLYDWVIAWDHRIGTAWLLSTGLPESRDAQERRARARMELVRERLGGRAAWKGGQADRPDRCRPPTPRQLALAGSPAPSYPVLGIEGAEQDWSALDVHPSRLSRCGSAGAGVHPRR